MTFTRLPALTLGMAAAAVQVAAGLFLRLTPDQTALVNAVIVAAIGVATAWLVKGDALVAALVGVGQAVLALTLGFGLAIPAPLQASIMGLVAAVAAAYVHTQVVAPVPAEPGWSPLEPAVVIPPPP